MGETKAAECRVIPTQWSAEWAERNSLPVAVLISKIEGHQASEVKPDTLRINGTVPSIRSWSIDRFGMLLAVINGAEAVRSLGTVVPGPVFPTVHGAFRTGEERFAAQCPVNMGLVFGLPKGVDFWKNPPGSDLIAGLLSPPLLLGTQVIDEVPEALAILNQAAASNLNDRLRAQLLTTELNLRAGAPKWVRRQPPGSRPSSWIRG